MSEPVHLISWESREESEVHCGDGLSRWPNTKTVREVTCRECLRLALGEALATCRAVNDRIATLNRDELVALQMRTQRAP